VLMEKFATNTGDLDPKLHGTFIEACRKALGKAPPSQYQYQEQKQNQKQEAALSRGSAARPPLRT
jgi:hypothetical protein